MIQPLPGFRDFYPEPVPSPDAWSCDLRQHIFETWRTTSRRYGFREYDGPPLESLELYTLKSGEEIVQQLFNFTDKGGREVAMRPEMTPTLARMVAAAERHYRKPIKWFAIPQLFRYEKQQRGRLREHFQFNADIFGESSPGADAELIALLIDSLRGLGLTADDFVIRVSSRRAWQAFLEARCADPSRAYDFYQAVDKLEREKPEVIDEKLRLVGSSLQEVREFIQASQPTSEIQTLLDELGARGLGSFVRVDYGVIRGLAYYTGIVFEAFDRKGKFRALAGGGRYDQLVHLVSGGKVNLPALGFGMGDVVLAELLKDRGLVRGATQSLSAYVLIEEESLRAESLRCVQSLREAGVSADFPLAATKSDKQFKRAVELAARVTVKLERAPDGAISARVREMTSRSEQVIPPDLVAAHCLGLIHRPPG
ncbi:MAG: ATP phosphoribosyltransferase regulatory subunit [Verrucomicrobiales bacterium]|nr:ATP phosphoribosyltransferase regulatory subunit [Verrucomicrobiales bacterium]